MTEYASSKKINTEYAMKITFFFVISVGKMLQRTARSETTVMDIIETQKSQYQ